MPSSQLDPLEAPPRQRPPSVTGVASRQRSVILFGLLLILLTPIWVPPAPVTTDGSSHVYNAMVAEAVDQNAAPYSAVLAYDRGPAPNRAASTLVGAAGRLVGWRQAERVMLTVIVVISLAVFSAHLGTGVVAALSAAWLTQHWFMWSGFFDFSLSVAGFALLVHVLQTPPRLRRTLIIQALAVYLVWAHMFTFAVAVGLIAWHGLATQRRLRGLLPAAPSALLLLALIVSGATGGGGISWGVKAKALAGLMTGDFLATFHPVSVVAGVLMMVGFWVTLYRHRTELLRRDTIAWRPVFAVLLVLASLLGPDAIGEGSYIGARLRFLAVLCVLPEIGALVRSVAPRPRAALAVGIGVVLAVHTVLAIRLFGRVAHDRAQLLSLLDDAGVQEGDGVQTALRDMERGLFRISGYAHIAATIATERRLIVLDNYEAALAIFPIRWIDRPQTLQVRQRAGDITLNRRPATRRTSSIHVVHDAAVPVSASDSTLELVTRSVGDLAVTSVRWAR